jgi:hypothetical protein
VPQHDTGRLGQRIRRWRRQGIQRGLPKTQQNLDIVGCAPGPASASAPQPPALYAAIQPLDFRPAPPPQRTHARGTLSLSRGPIRAPKANMRLTILNLHDPLAFLPRSHAALLARSPHARVQRTPASCRSCALPWAWTTARASTRCTEGRDRAATEGRAANEGRDGAAGPWFTFVTPLSRPPQNDIIDMLLAAPHLLAHAGAFAQVADSRGWSHARMVRARV